MTNDSIFIKEAKDFFREVHPILSARVMEIYNSRDFFIDEKDMDESNPYIVPLKGDYKNCPPMLIQVGTEELLLSDSQTLKEVLERDECIHEYYEWEGMYHVFHLDARMPETIEAFNQIGNFLKKYIKKSNAKL